MTTSRFGATVLLVATFVLGGLIGGAFTSMAEKRSHKGPGPDVRREHRRPSYVDRLSEDLDLTIAQRESVQAVLDRHQPAMDSLWERFRPQFESERQGIRKEISTLLTAEQQAKYTGMIQRQDSLRREAERKRNDRR